MPPSTTPNISQSQPNTSNIEAILRNMSSVLGQVNANVMASVTAINALTTAVKAVFPPALTSSASWTPGAIGNNSTVGKSVTVTGAALGQVALASFSLSLAGATISAYTSASNTVEAIITNNSGSTVTLGAGTLLVLALQGN